MPNRRIDPPGHTPFYLAPLRLAPLGLVSLLMAAATAMAEPPANGALAAPSSQFQPWRIADSVALPCRDADGIALGDLTGNGKLDILASEGKHGTTVWFEQGDNWKSWTRHEIHTMTEVPFEMAAT